MAVAQSAPRQLWVREPTQVVSCLCRGKTAWSSLCQAMAYELGGASTETNSYGGWLRPLHFGRGSSFRGRTAQPSSQPGQSLASVRRVRRTRRVTSGGSVTAGGEAVSDRDSSSLPTDPLCRGFGTSGLRSHPGGRSPGLRNGHFVAGTGCARRTVLQTWRGVVPMQVVYLARIFLLRHSQISRSGRTYRDLTRCRLTGWAIPVRPSR